MVPISINECNAYNAFSGLTWSKNEILSICFIGNVYQFILPIFSLLNFQKL